MRALRRSVSGFALVAVTLLAAAAVSCSSKFFANASGSASTNHAPPENTTAPVDALETSSHPGLSACASSVSSGDLEASLQIAKDYRQSTHELVVCGGLATDLGSAVVDILIRAAIGGTTPSFTFDSATSTYVTGAGATGSAGTVMKIVAMLGADTSFGKKGDVIKFDLTDAATYFTGLKVTASASINTSGETKTSLTVSYTGLGPGVEILGLGKTPANPLQIDSATISDSIGRILIHTTIHVDDKQGDSVFGYDVDIPTQTLSSALAGDPVGFALSGTPSGTNVVTGQSLAITQWKINYLDTGSSGYMDGTIAFDVKAGKLPYHVVMKYPQRKEPDITLSCGSGA